MNKQACLLSIDIEHEIKVRVKFGWFGTISWLVLQYTRIYTITRGMNVYWDISHYYECYQNKTENLKTRTIPKKLINTNKLKNIHNLI